MPGDRNSASRCSGQTNDAGQIPPRLLRAAELYRWAAERVGTGGIDGQNLRKTAFNAVLAGVAIMLPRRYPISWMVRTPRQPSEFRPTVSALGTVSPPTTTGRAV